MEDERKAIHKLLNSVDFTTVIKSQINKVLKDSQQSELLRKEANNFYKEAVHDARQHHGVWQFYSMSIARAESNTEGLAMSYGNRSAILLHLSKYEASIRDIDRALNITKNNSLKIKLLLRKAKCLYYSGSEVDQDILKKVNLLLKEITNKSLRSELEAEIGQVKVVLKKPFVPNEPPKNTNAKALKTLNEQHKLNDFSLLQMQFNEKYGRHLVAAKDIKPGEAIYVEKPYVQFTNLLKMHAYCVNCFATVWDNIPCEHCCWAMFCSESCKKEAWENYHEIECSVYGDFKMDTKDSFTQLALRILSRSLKKYGDIEHLKARLSKFDDSKDYKNGFLQKGSLQAKGLKSIYYLCKNIPSETLTKHIKNTALILRSFGRNTSFFGKKFDWTNVESYKNNDDVIFLGSLFLRLSQISQLNAFQMWNRSYFCQNLYDESVCIDTECCTAGTYIAPITGLLNHDCFPNAGRCYTSGHTVLLYAIEPIKKGDQIFTTYLKIFCSDMVNTRKDKLSQIYNFNCDCFSCLHKLESGSRPIRSMNEVVQRPLDLLDMQISVEYTHIMNNVNYETYNCDEKTIIHLGKGLEKVFASSRPKKPSISKTSLVGCIQIVFDKIYGIKLKVPSYCNVGTTIMEEEKKAILTLFDSIHCVVLIQGPYFGCGSVNKVLKDSQQSDLLRKQGNDAYKEAVHNADLHDKAWQLYSKSIARAEANTEGLAMSFGNRSAILLHLSKYEASIRNIDRALNITENNSLKIKLLLRKAKCLHMTGSKDSQSILKRASLLLKEITNKNQKSMLEAEMDKVKIIMKEPIVRNTPLEDANAKALMTLNKKNKINDFSSLQMQFNEKYGRHLVAAKDIKSGDVIYIEKPHVQSVNPLKMHAYCTHCFARVWDSIPCDHCCWAMFCSESCKKEAWEKYHQIECSVYADLQSYPNDSSIQLPLRILSQALKEYGDIEHLKAELSSFDDCTDYKAGFMHNGKLQANGLKSIYYLCKNVTSETLTNCVTNTILVLRSFGRNTSFFGKDFDWNSIRSYKKNQNVVFLGALFLRLGQVNQLNSFQMWNRTYGCQNKKNELVCTEKKCCTVGSYIAPITGLLNHDCYPNAGRCYTKDHKVLLYAILPIKKGDQIFTSYLKNFGNDSLAARKKFLPQIYNFECDCYSCEQKLEAGLKQNESDSPLVDLIQQPPDLVEALLTVEYNDIMISASNGDIEDLECSENTIDRLKKGIERLFPPSRPYKPSVSKSTFVGCMQVAFDKIYGIPKMDVPAHCNNV